LKEEPSEDEEEPNNPAYDALVEMNRAMRRANEEWED
jgi:hypothetical protein